MKHSFGTMPVVNRKRSVFNRSFGHKFTCDADKLIPFHVDEFQPGDTHIGKMTAFIRMNTPVDGADVSPN